MRTLIIALAIANLGQAPAATGGTVRGTVTAVANGRPVRVDELYVYLEGEKKPSSSLGAKVVAKIEQKNTRFIPFVTVVPIGARVFFPNRDSEEHSVFSPSVKRNGWIGFDLGRYNTDRTGRHRKFREAGEFDIYCDIHKDMWAKVKAVPTHHFVKVVDGRYAFRGIPPGTYRAVAWSPDSRESRSQPFQVTAEGTVTVEGLNLQKTTRSAHHVRKDGSPYPSYQP